MKRDKHAELYYYEIINNGKDTFVNKISKNTGLSKRFVTEVYEHVFINKHLLDSGYKKFYPSYNMSVSFQRLMQGNYNDADILLLHHEHLERALEKRYNLTNRQAHNYAKTKYDYFETFRKGGMGNGMLAQKKDVKGNIIIYEYYAEDRPSDFGIIEVNIQKHTWTFINKTDAIDSDAVAYEAVRAVGMMFRDNNYPDYTYMCE